MIRLEEAAKRYAGHFHPLDGEWPWETISPTDREEILRTAAEYAEKPYPMRTAAGFLSFVRDGSRKADEDPYFFRRRKLCYAALACRLEEKRPLDDVIDGIWCICEETSWVISAHNVNAIPGAPRAEDYPLPDPEKPYVDLFAAQTGMILTLVRGMLGERLDQVTPMIGQRITREVRKRILDPFLETDDFWWMGFRRKDLCNWTPWIVSNVMLCALSEPMKQSDRDRIMIRGCGMLDRWMDCVPADGGCDEGAGYWNMAGGALLDCLEMTEESTGGSLTFWEEEKTRNILQFPAKAEIGGGYFLNFADCDARPYLSGERILTAGEKLGDAALISLGRRILSDASVELSDVPHFIRMLKRLFHPGMKPQTASDGMKNERQTGNTSAEQTTYDMKAADSAGAGEVHDPDIWLPDLQVRVVRRGGWTLAAKGGHNGESHNHNDVGSFMLYLDGKPEIVDAGNMTYTAKTFSDRRYELWNTRSAYHNLPLIGGREQQAGKIHAARETEYLPDGLRLDMAEAYAPDAGVRSCLRRISLSEEGMILEDRIRLKSPQEVTWVFLLRNEPCRTENGIAAGGIRMNVPKDWETETEEIPITDPRMAKNWTGSLWRLRITDVPGKEHQAEWRICKAA